MPAMGPLLAPKELAMSSMGLLIAPEELAGIARSNGSESADGSGRITIETPFPVRNRAGSVGAIRPESAVP